MEFIHWLIISSGSSLCFDVDGEQLKQMPMPMPMPPIPQMNDGMEQRNVRADNSGWFVNHHIDLDAVAGVFPEMIMSSSLEFWELTSYAFEILAFFRGESDED
ncbi:hypothetical protein POTOM_018264 [Populus tomentosa]|uniref:Uncharacterized protein n=1 Tax=Populus tomentosa TaxID=118781 RepID=A0A8X8D5I0_POPTO|nr:hypothetical protein POTOM_018264 [Populus tomentosa]